jgi:hypothetical protein
MRMQPLSPAFSIIARRHIALFVRGIRTPANQPLPAPQVTPQDIEDAFAAAEPGPC